MSAPDGETLMGHPSVVRHVVRDVSAALAEVGQDYSSEQLGAVCGVAMHLIEATNEGSWNSFAELLVQAQGVVKQKQAKPAVVLDHLVHLIESRRPKWVEEEIPDVVASLALVEAQVGKIPVEVAGWLEVIASGQVIGAGSWLRAQFRYLTETTMEEKGR